MSDSVFNIFGEIGDKNTSVKALHVQVQVQGHNSIKSIQDNINTNIERLKHKKSFLHNNVILSTPSTKTKTKIKACTTNNRELHVYEDEDENEDEDLVAMEYTKTPTPTHAQDDHYLSDTDELSDSLMEKYVYGIPDRDDLPSYHFDKIMQINEHSSPVSSALDFLEYDQLDDPIFHDDDDDDDDFKLINF